MSGLILAGDLYLDLLDAAGNRTGFLQPVNCTQFAITEPSDLKQRVSRMKSTFGQALDTIGIKKPSTIDVTIDENTKEVFAMNLLGAISGLTKASGTVATGSPEAISAALGKVVQLANLDVSNVVLKAHGGTPTDPYAVGTDYQVVSAEAGLIYFPPTSTITDGEALDATYSYGAQAGTIVAGGEQPVINVAMKLDGKNLVDGKGVIIDVDFASFLPKGALGLLNADFVPYKLGATLKTLTGKTSPYTVKLKGVQ